jgi:hypothetical protein
MTDQHVEERREQVANLMRAFRVNYRIYVSLHHAVEVYLLAAWKLGYEAGVREREGEKV